MRTKKTGTGKSGNITGGVFVSYCSKDRETVLTYLKWMESLSLPYWWDRRLQAGSRFSNVIARRIKEKEAFILFLSQDSANSWFVEDEVFYACNNRKPIIVIRLQDDVHMPEGMEMHLSGLNHLMGSDGPEKCVNNIITALRDGTVKEGEPVDHGIWNHDSDLLSRCRESLEHLACQMGVTALETDIDENLLCPIRITENKETHFTDLYNAICEDNHRHVLLQADGGYGKTYTFLYTMKRLLDCDRPCAYIPCYLFTEERREGPGLILDKLCGMYLTGQQRSEDRLNEYFRQQTKRSFILFLDGYNEAVAKDQLAKEIVELSNVLPRVKIVISSRYGGSGFTNYASCTMQSLNAQNVAMMLKDQKKFSMLDFSLQKLLMIPMFLRLYLGMETIDAKADTAAELMDQERKRVLRSIRQGASAMHKRCLNEVFPGFVRQEYCLRDRQLSFFGDRLREYLREHFPDEETAERAFRFLEEYSLIFRIDERTDTWAYKHEHFRDYWVANAVFRSLMKIRESVLSGEERAEKIIEELSGDYSGMVLRYIGELAGTGEKESSLDPVLDGLRRQQVGRDSLWRDAAMADATAKLIEIYKLAREGRMIGKNLEELNLSEAQLNEAYTCTRTEKAKFRGSLIAERTFIASLHESAPRRVELMRIGEREYLISVSNMDLMISTLPELDRIWRYPHRNPDGTAVATNTLTVSASLEDCLLAVDYEGAVWEWRFEERSGIPFVSPVFRHPEGEPAAKVFPWSDEDGPLIGLQRRDGVILNLARDEDASEGGPALTPIDDGRKVPELQDKDTRKTLTSSPRHLFFCWAEGTEDGIHVMKYSMRGAACTEVCFIPEADVTPDYMLCAGSEQASREEKGKHFGASDQDGMLLILTAVNHERTRMYQIRLPRSGGGTAEVRRLNWTDGKDELLNDYQVTQRQSNRVNAMSFSEGHMLLAVSDGHIYHYVYDGTQEQFVPDSGMPRVKLAEPTFAVEDVLYLSAERIAAVTVNRMVHLIDARSMFEVRKLRGYYDGLRRLVPVDGDTILATSYDGAVLELQKGNKRWICKDKIPGRGWCWALEKISGSLYAAGYFSEVTLLNLDTDTILFRLSGLEQKVEHLLYLPEAENRLLVVNKSGVRVFRVELETGRLEDSGKIILPVEAPCCYWSMKHEVGVFLALCDGNDKNPRIGWLSPDKLKEEQTPEIIETGSDYGRIRDLHGFGKHLMACGMCDEERRPQVKVFDVSDPQRTRLEYTIGGFPTFLVHSAVFPAGEKAWRIAIVDGNSKGGLHQILLTEGADGALTHECLTSSRFPGILCDVAFDENGDLLLTCLDGALYHVAWGQEDAEELFRNKSYMLTFGADLSDLSDPVAPDSPLGRILTDFGNRLTKGRRILRGNR